MASILLIDDDPQIRDLFTESLSAAGHQVITAPDGAAGMAAYRKGPCDLVITDIVMPNQEGLETIRSLRREDPDIPIIAISGGGHLPPDLYLQAANVLGATRILEKPVGLTVLLATVAEVLAC